MGSVFSPWDLSRVRWQFWLKLVTCKNTVILPQVMVCIRGRRNNPLQGVQCAVIHRLLSVSAEIQGLRVSGPESWKVESEPTQRSVVLQYISQSPEIWDTYGAWLESWIPKLLCHSGSSLLSMNPAVCLPLYQKDLLYTLPALTKTTTNYMEKAAAVTAYSTMVCSSTLNPVFWGLLLCAWVCLWMLCGFVCLNSVSSVLCCF